MKLVSLLWQSRHVIFYIHYSFDKKNISQSHNGIPACATLRCFRSVIPGTFFCYEIFVHVLALCITVDGITANDSLTHSTFYQLNNNLT
jgi:hypothetical protein